MKQLTSESLAALVRTGSVTRIHLTPHPAIDGGGWYLDVDHADHGQTRMLHTQRGDVRVFKTSDAAIKAILDADYRGPVALVLKGV